MPTLLTESNFRSRKTRRDQTRDPLGVRRINPQRENPTEIIGSGAVWLAKKLARFVGFLFGAITRAFPLSISSIFQMLVQSYFLIKTFDWNQTDAAIQARLNANNKAIKDGLAPVIGTALGFGTVRLANFIIGKTAGKAAGASNVTKGINIPVLSARVGLALAEEGNQEVRGQLLNYLMTVQRSLTDNLFLSFMLTARNHHWFGWEPVKAPLPNASFAAKIETKIETLPLDWQNFAEELIESYEEAVIEAGYVIAFEIDDYYLAQKMASKAVQGGEKTVEITFEPKRV